MGQTFVCKCREKQCREWIRGAKWLSEEQVEGNWTNAWVLGKLKEKWEQNGGVNEGANGNSSRHVNGAANGTNGEAREEA